MSGFYLMHRGWMDDPLFVGEPFTRAQAWEWLIHEATFEPHKIKHPTKMEMIEVQRGQVATSFRKLKEKFQWGNERVRRFIDVLVSEGKIGTQTGTGFLVITICNYDKFQRPKEKAGTHLGTQTGTGSGTHLGTPIYKDKKEGIKKGKEIVVVGTRFALQDPPVEWLDFCRTQRPDLNPGILFDSFRDFWIAKAGKDGRKLDWYATWRNWVRNQKSNSHGNNGTSKPTKQDIIQEQLAKARAMREQAAYQ